MSPSTTNDRATAKPVNIPTVIAAGCSDALLARCWDVIAPLGVMVRDCEPAALATLAASRQPLVIVVPSALYARDPEDYDALARDVRALLVHVDEASARDLDVTLSLAVRTSMRRREGRMESARPCPATLGPQVSPSSVRAPSRSGRYSILPGDPIEGGEWAMAPVSSRSARVPEPVTTGPRAAPLGLEELEEELLSAIR